MLHIYGQLGPCGWLASGHGRPFHSQLDTNQVKASAEDIAIIGTDIPHARTERATKMIESAERVCFLGFGYHEFTLKLLLDCGLGKKGDVHGTSYGLLKGEASTPRRMMPAIQLHNAQILDFLRTTDFIHAPVKFGKSVVGA